MAVQGAYDSQQAVAIFAGGCFWCMQPPFDACEGVLQTEVGYTGGHASEPNYAKVCRGDSGHYEAVRVVYDPAKVGYEALLQIFWHNIDPTQEDGQFADRGSQYRTAIFYHNAEQQRLAEASKEALQASGKFIAPIATRILPAARFYVAEDDHQRYYEKNSLHYQRYKQGSGRAAFIERLWKKGQDG